MKYLCLLLSALSCLTFANDHRQLVEFPASDKLVVVADHYFHSRKNLPVILMFHQPQSSRGEFRYIAERLYDIGYQVLAVDLRSGDFAHGKTNLTHVEARKGRYERRFADSYLDFEASLAYSKKAFGDVPIYVLASSFNSVLAMKLAVEHPEDVDALLLLSPLTYDLNMPTSLYAPDVHVPTWITSDSREAAEVKAVYDAIPAKQKVRFVPTIKDVAHASRLLESDYKEHQKQWRSMLDFLSKVMGN